MKEKGPLFFVWTVITPLFPALFSSVILPFFHSIALFCFRLKLQPTIPSLVGGFGSKVLKCGAGSSLDLLSIAGG